MVNDFIVEASLLVHRPVGRSVGWEEHGAVGLSVGLPFNESVRMLNWSVGWSTVRILSLEQGKNGGKGKSRDIRKGESRKGGK